MCEKKPTRVLSVQGKLHNGLYVEEVLLYEDRIAFRVFASQPFSTEDLGELRLSDDVGTDYVMVARGESVSEGRTAIEFEPSPPEQWSSLDLAEPGWGLHIRNAL